MCRRLDRDAQVRPTRRHHVQQKKTGSVCIGSELNPGLPKGAVGWGFLVFDSVKGRFVVDQAAVDIHIAELRRQLASAKSVFGYVNALNKVLISFQ
jgi:hypothetical protein